MSLNVDVLFGASNYDECFFSTQPDCNLDK